MHVVGRESEGAKEARLRYTTLCQRSERSLLEVTLETGRKHQIRLQLGSRGFPIVGDRKYGSSLGFPLGIALHARRVRLVHPVKKTELLVESPLPPSWGKVRQWRPADGG